MLINITLFVTGGFLGDLVAATPHCRPNTYITGPCKDVKYAI